MGKPTIEQLQKQLNTETKERQSDAQRGRIMWKAQQSMTAFILMVLEKGEDLVVAAERIGTAYAVASKRHQEALTAQDKIKALETQLLFSVLTVATSGLLSWAAETAKAAEEAKVLADLDALDALSARALSIQGNDPLIIKEMIGAAKGNVERAAKNRALSQGLFSTVVKDTLAAGLGEGFSALGPMYAPPSPSDPVNSDPLVFQNQLVKRIGNLKIGALDYLRRTNDSLNDIPIDKWDDYVDSDFKKAMGWWLHQADALAGQSSLPTDETMAKDLERAMWAAWMPRLHSVRTSYADRGAGHKEEDWEGVYSPVAARFKELNILQEANVDIEWYHRAETEDRGLIAWASKFKLDPWADGTAPGG